MEVKYIFLIISYISITLAKEHMNDDKSSTKYAGYSVIRMEPSTDIQLEYIKSLEEDRELDFWIIPSTINRSVDVMISPQKLQFIKNNLDKNKIKYFVLIENVQSLINSQHRHVSSSRWKRDIPLFFESYHKSDEIYEFIDELKNTVPSLMDVEDVGTTYQGKKLKLVKIKSNSPSTKPIVWIDGGIHAREWISTATATYFIYKILSDYKTDPSIISLLNAYDWYIMPIVNPDGYDFSFEPGKRLWRKNLSKSSTHSNGVDLNRNFPYGWNNSLSTSYQRNPEDETYMGPSPLSEYETQAIARILTKEKERVKLFISLHSYKQFVLYPWGCKRESTGDVDQMIIALRAAKEMTSAFGVLYLGSSIIKALYPSPGCSTDWTYGELGIRYSYVIELRDKGTQGFLLDASQITPVGEETWKGVQTMALTLNVKINARKFNMKTKL